jgi:hypothetical protein
VPIAIPEVYEQTLWILQYFLLANPDLHHGLLGSSMPLFLSLSCTDLVPIYRRLLEIDDGYDDNVAVVKKNKGKKNQKVKERKGGRIRQGI